MRRVYPSRPSEAWPSQPGSAEAKRSVPTRQRYSGLVSSSGGGVAYT